MVRRPAGLHRARVVANFVATIDGVVAIPGLTQSNKLISADSEADRFVMGLLRAFADTVLVGSGTLRGSPADRVDCRARLPAGGSAFADLRNRRGRPPTATRDDRDRRRGRRPPGLRGGAVVLTTERGAKALDARLPDGCEVVVLPGTTMSNRRLPSQPSRSVDG